MNKIVGWVVTLVVVGAAAYFLVPAFRAKVDDAIDKGWGWTPERRRKDPVGFLKYSEKKLQENIDKFEDVKVGLRSSQGTLEAKRTQNLTNLQFAVKTLAEFKAAFATVSSGGKWPVSVAGKEYDEPKFKSQVALLLSQRKGYENVAVQFDKTLIVVERKLNEVVDRINDSKAKLQMLDSQRTLVEAKQLGDETEKILAEVNDVLLANEAFSEKSAVRTVEEMMKDAEEADAPGSSPDVDAFLKS